MLYMNPSVMSHYHGLWQVEESFRITKHDLRVRPIWHWNSDRIRAHIAIAFMAFACRPRPRVISTGADRREA